MKKICLVFFISMCFDTFLFAGYIISQQEVYTKITQWEQENREKIDKELVYEYILAWNNEDSKKLSNILNTVRTKDLINYFSCILFIIDENQYGEFMHLATPFFLRGLKEISQEDLNKQLYALIQNKKMHGNIIRFICDSTGRWINKEYFEKTMDILISIAKDKNNSDGKRLSALNGIRDASNKIFYQIVNESSNGKELDIKKVPYSQVESLLLQSDQKELYLKIKDIVSSDLDIIDSELKSGPKDRMFYSHVYTVIYRYSFIVGKEEILKRFKEYIIPENNIPWEPKLSIAQIFCVDFNTKDMIPDLEKLVAAWERIPSDIKQKDKESFFSQKTSVQYIKKYIKENRSKE